MSLPRESRLPAPPRSPFQNGVIASTANSTSSIAPLKTSSELKFQPATSGGGDPRVRQSEFVLGASSGRVPQRAVLSRARSAKELAPDSDALAPPTSPPTTSPLPSPRQLRGGDETAAAEMRAQIAQRTATTQRTFEKSYATRRMRAQAATAGGAQGGGEEGAQRRRPTLTELTRTKFAGTRAPAL